MVGPPPPPPPGPPPTPGPPPPPAMGGFKLGGGSGGGDPRAALLQSIQKGAKLKKTVTVDKSKPMVAGKVAGESSTTNSGPRATTKPVNGGPPLGGLFEGMSTMPKLKPVNGRGTTPPSRPSPPAQSQSPSTTAKSNSNAQSSTQNNGPMDFNAELTKHLTLKKQKQQQHQQQQVNATEANLRTNRGPPPQPPTLKNITSSPSDTVLEKTNSMTTTRTAPAKPASPTERSEGNSNRLGKKNASLSLTIGNSNVNNNSTSSVQTPLNVAPNKSSLFGSNNSSTSSSPSPVPPSIKPVVNHGKPNCAPKPPGLQQLVANGKPTVARHHSMKSPRSPPIAPAGGLSFPTTHFGTLRGAPQQFQSQEAINVNVRQPPSVPVGRPTVAPPKPPSIKPPPPPTPARSVSNTNLTNIPLSTAQSANNNSTFGSTSNVSTLKEQFKNQLNHAGSASNVSNLFSNSINDSNNKGSTLKLSSPVNKEKKLAVNGSTVPPPLPPHRTSPAPPPPQRQLSNTPSSASTFAPPVPPQRHSSIRTSVTSVSSITSSPAPPPPVASQGSVQRLALDLEARFAGRFHNVTEFPSPPPFLKIPKHYPSRNIRTSNVSEIRKQRAPNPPTLQIPQDSGILQLNSDKLFTSDQSYC